MTRLEEPKRANVDIVKKMKLYDGEEVEGYKSKDVRELKDETVREGMDGISPRYIINRLSSALVRDGVTCINPIDALRTIKSGFEQHTGITPEQRERYLNLISAARKEYDEMAKIEVQRAFVYSFEEMARTICNNYLDNVEAYCNKERIKDPITEEEVEPDEQLMRSTRSRSSSQGMRIVFSLGGTDHCLGWFVWRSSRCRRCTRRRRCRGEKF
jgi:serine protein kinase